MLFDNSSILILLIAGKSESREVKQKAPKISKSDERAIFEKPPAKKSKKEPELTLMQEIEAVLSAQPPDNVDVRSLSLFFLSVFSFNLWG